MLSLMNACVLIINFDLTYLQIKDRDETQTLDNALNFMICSRLKDNIIEK